MAGPTVDFDAPDLANQIENLSQADLNALPFGVMLLDQDGVVRFYSDTEARLSGYNQSAVGLNLYEFCERFGGADFRGRIADEARHQLQRPAVAQCAERADGLDHHRRVARLLHFRPDGRQRLFSAQRNDLQQLSQSA